MRSRCKPECKQAKDYFHRGIQVCDRWEDYSLFLADMGERPEGMSLDRIDNDKGYDPSNCRWATPGQQRRNCRRVATIAIDGREMPLKDAAQGLGFSDVAVQQERRRHGGTIQEAFDRVYQRAKARNFERYVGFT